MIASARSGKNTGPGRLRSTARKSAKTRMNTSAMQKILMFSRNARAISGNVDLELVPVEELTLAPRASPGRA